MKPVKTGHRISKDFVGIDSHMAGSVDQANVSSVEEYFSKLFSRLSEAVPIRFSEVSLGEWKPKANECHQNVDFWIKGHPPHIALRGWLTWGPDDTGRCRFVAHSVVSDRDSLFDITPFVDERMRNTASFLRHVGAEVEFSALKIRYSEVYFPFVSQEEWEHWQLEANLKNVSDEDSGE
jgi:hypothetical protein